MLHPPPQALDAHPLAQEDVHPDLHEAEEHAAVHPVLHPLPQVLDAQPPPQEDVHPPLQNVEHPDLHEPSEHSYEHVLVQVREHDALQLAVQ